VSQQRFRLCSVGDLIFTMTGMTYLLKPWNWVRGHPGPDM